MARDRFSPPRGAVGHSKRIWVRRTGGGFFLEDFFLVNYGFPRRKARFFFRFLAIFFRKEIRVSSEGKLRVIRDLFFMVLTLFGPSH